jgi:hypothetical protein
MKLKKYIDFIKESNDLSTTELRGRVINRYLEDTNQIK